jgi:hypothetical protein
MQVSMNDMAAMCMEIAATHGRKGAMPINHIPGPEGVRGRNSNNELIKQVRNILRGLRASFISNSAQINGVLILWTDAGKS